MRKPLLAGVAVLLVLLGILVTLLLPRPCPVTREAYRRIGAGPGPPPARPLSVRQVEEVLGCPPGDYRNGPTREFGAVGQPDPAPGFDPPGDERFWWGDEGVIVVGVYPDGSVAYLRFVESAPEGGWLQTLSWRLKRRWEALRGRGGT